MIKLGTPIYMNGDIYYILDIDEQERPVWIGKIVDPCILFRDVQREISKWRKKGWRAPSIKWFEQTYGRTYDTLKPYYRNMIENIESSCNMKIGDFWTSTTFYACRSKCRYLYETITLPEYWRMGNMDLRYATNDIKHGNTLMVIKKCHY